MTPEEILTSTRHRPWPLPAGPWVMFQCWRDLLFAHWALPAQALAPHIPPPLMLEQFDGSAWLGLTPFLIDDLHARGIPPIPGLSRFPELNLRTYVRHRERSGIFFFSLDAANAAAVLAARALYRLPYRNAAMTIDRDGEWIRYRSRRADGNAAFEGRYRPTGEEFEPQPGSLEQFLVERYAFHTVLRDGRVLSCDIHHPPWTLRVAEADIDLNTIPAAAGILMPDTPTLLYFSARQDTLIWPPDISR